MYIYIFIYMYRQFSCGVRAAYFMLPLNILSIKAESPSGGAADLVS